MGRIDLGWQLGKIFNIVDFVAFFDQRNIGYFDAAIGSRASRHDAIVLNHEGFCFKLKVVEASPNRHSHARANFYLWIDTKCPLLGPDSDDSANIMVVGWDWAQPARLVE